MGSIERSVRRASQLVSEADRVVVLTGAGVSAESGVPTFRGTEGLWRRYRPEELATPEAFSHDPKLVWEWYDWRRQLVSECHPNAAHTAIAASAIQRGTLQVLTQNVDGLHSRAALSSAADLGLDPSPGLPLELHGSLFRARCVSCGSRLDLQGAAAHDHVDNEGIPRCEGCGEMLRPDIVWFGEALDRSVLDAAFEVASQADLCLVVGTSALVQPTASLPGVTRSGGGRVIEVNPESTPVSAIADVSLRSSAASVVPLLFDGRELSGS